jgi:outer membrane protein
MQWIEPGTKKAYWIVVLFALLLPLSGIAQTPPTDSVLQSASLNQVVQYALSHQPAIQQAQIDEEITDRIIKGKLADWYPQVNFTYNFLHYMDLQASVIGGNVIRFGVENTSATQFTATQALINRDVVFASSTASKVKLQAGQNTTRSKIDVVVSVTKAFYDVLATKQQIKVSEESIQRLQRSLQDSYSRYLTGVADKTDYKRATILLTNTKAALKTNQEQLEYKQKYLKSVMGYPLESELVIQYDTLQLERDIILDTLQKINYTEHIDYRILFTQKELQEANVKYSKWAYLPSLNAVGAYILNFQSNVFGELYDTSYPFSYVGASLTFPIFQGGKRVAKVREQQWTSKRLDWSLINLENALNTEYTRALSTYKASLAAYHAQRENVVLAREVYDIIYLQYTNGVRAYLDVAIAESELRTTRINYFNALYIVLSSKLDVQRALGQINY